MENQIWYDVSGTPTKLTDIKYGSFHYHSDVGVSGKMRLGNVCSAFIEFDYLLSNGVTFSIGDALRYKQNFPEQDSSFNPADTDYVRNIGIYYITSIDNDGKTCHVTAFDAISKLDVDFSKRLRDLKPSFPMSIRGLCDEVESVVGVTINGIPATLGSSTVNYFYANGLTCRDVVKAIAELCSIDAEATSSGGIIFRHNFLITGLLTIDAEHGKGYVICPDDETYTITDLNSREYLLTNIWYKENGLRLGEPISLYNIAYAYDSRGNILDYWAWDTPTNAYEFFIANNIISQSGITWSRSGYTLSFSIGSQLKAIFANVDNRFGNTYDFVSGSIRLFPFRNPYHVGGCAIVVDADGNYHIFPVMSLDLSENEVVIESYSDKTVGAEAQNGVGGNGIEDRSLALDVRVTALEDEVAQKGSDLLLSRRNIPTTATAYACDWADYDILIINGMFYGNTVSSYVVTKDYFNGTTSTARVMVIDPVNSNRRYAVYKKDDGNIYALMESGTTGAAYGINIYGVKL